MYRYSNCASALAFSVALGFLATPALSKSTGEDATTYQINAAHDGHIDFAAGFNAPLVRAWTYDTGDGSGSYPVIGGGMLFFVGNGNDAFAFDLASAAGFGSICFPRDRTGLPTTTERPCSPTTREPSPRSGREPASNAGRSVSVTMGTA